MEQKYCIVATDRSKAYNRVMITGPMSENSAYELSAAMQKDKVQRSQYKYFKVAKYPYKEIR